MRLRLIVGALVIARIAAAQPGAVMPLPQPLPPPEMPVAEDDGSEPTTGTARLGTYSDSDQTRVLRAMAALGKTWGAWTFSADATVDAVSSASIDVRSSPL